MNYSQIAWNREVIEEWIGIAVLVDRCMPPVYRRGISGQRLEIQRSWTELLWDAEEIKKRTPRWEPTAEQVTMWEEVILRWFPKIPDGPNRKIVWLRACGASWPRIAKVVGMGRTTVITHHADTIEDLVKKIPNLYPKISRN